MLVAIDGSGKSKCCMLGLMDSEKGDEFAWFFQQVKLALGEGNFMKTLFTDGDVAIMSAAARELPRVLHRLCSFHIHQNLNTKLAGRLGADFTDFMTSFVRCEYQPAAELFYARWALLKEDYPEAVDYLNTFLDRYVV